MRVLAARRSRWRELAPLPCSRYVSVPDTRRVVTADRVRRARHGALHPGPAGAPGGARWRAPPTARGRVPYLSARRTAVSSRRPAGPREGWTGTATPARGFGRGATTSRTRPPRVTPIASGLGTTRVTSFVSARFAAWAQDAAARIASHRPRGQDSAAPRCPDGRSAPTPFRTAAPPSHRPEVALAPASRRA